MNRDTWQIGQFVFKPKKYIRLLVNILISFFSVVCGYLIYRAGGTQQAYVHFIYIPIIMSGFYSGIFYGALQGIIAGIVLGPFMPQSTELMISQPSDSWVFRTFIFAIIGGFAGVFSTVSRSYHNLFLHQYFYDAVTNLPNFRGLTELMKKERRKHDDYSGAIAIKIKQYIDITQAFGPNIAEKLLLRITEQLQNVLAGQGLIGRLENNQFIILVNPEFNVEDIIIKCRQNLVQEYNLNDISVFIELHYGYAFSQEANDLNDLLRKTGNAVERSIEQKCIQVAYSHDLDERAEENIFIINALNHALSNNELQLFYQPKINLETLKIVGLEALIRWNHPTRGYIPPDLFILTLEKTLLINTFSKWVINESMNQLSEWNKAGIAVPLAINLSMINFDDMNVINQLLNEIKIKKIPHHFVEIELTESAISSNIHKVADILKNLQSQGIRIAIDDFGTGLSSLNYLFELPVNILKIDQTFIKAMLLNSAAEAIVRSAVKLGQELNLSIVAEGIESDQQVQALKKIGCDVGQGYYLGMPMPVNEITALLQSCKI